jgi:uncharacterized protein (DUF2062 family)
MPKKTLLKYLPNADKIRRNSSLQPVAHLLERSQLWHVNRHSVSLAVFIGLFCAFVPVPAQMLLAALGAIWLNANLPISVGLVWISNPVTMGPMFYFAYKLGAWLLGVEASMDNFSWNFNWFLDNAPRIGYPFLLGCLICSWVSAVSGYVLAQLLWRTRIIRKWNRRRS